MSMRAGRRGGRAGAPGRPPPPAGADLTLGPRLEYKHVSRGHEFHVSAPAVAAGADGRPVLAWAAQEGHDQPALSSPGPGDHGPVRVNPDGLGVEALHHPPRLAIAPGRRPVYVSWSSEKRQAGGHALRLRPAPLALARRRPDVRGAAAGERGPPDLALVRRRSRWPPTAPCSSTWIDGHEGPPDPGHLGRARGRAGHARRADREGRRRHLRVLPGRRGGRGGRHGGARLAPGVPGRRPRHGDGGLARRRAHLRRCRRWCAPIAGRSTPARIAGARGDWTAAGAST